MVVLREAGRALRADHGVSGRWRASQRAGKQTIPAVVRQVSDEQAMEMTIVENLQRADLNPMEQARAYAQLSSEFKLTQEQMAERTGKDRTSISNFLRLLKLPESVQLRVEAGELSFGHARALLGLQTPGTIEHVVKAILARVDVGAADRGVYPRDAEPGAEADGTAPAA